MVLFISDTQFAFISGQLITDSVLLANEVIHSIKKGIHFNGGFVLKLDFEKAFDCVDRDFILRVMEVMGFGSRWIS